jgi:hypothetical protein
MPLDIFQTKVKDWSRWKKLTFLPGPLTRARYAAPDSFTLEGLGGGMGAFPTERTVFFAPTPIFHMGRVKESPISAACIQCAIVCRMV